MVVGKDFAYEIVSSLSLLVGLLRLVKDRRHPNEVLAGLSLLKTVCSHEPVRSSVVSIGAIPQLVEIPNLLLEFVSFGAADDCGFLSENLS
jgi:hypothetical protein